LGFFRFAYRIPSVDGSRLLVSPKAAAEGVSVRAKGGEANRQDSLTLERTDYLIDHRPYVPGDDPRRINWKLYSHGGELIIRQGEREPPPSSNLTILIDTQYDSLYSSNRNSAAEAVDLLCESALAIINNAGKDINIQIGFTGQNEKSGNYINRSGVRIFSVFPGGDACGNYGYGYIGDGNIDASRCNRRSGYNYFSAAKN